MQKRDRILTHPFALIALWQSSPCQPRWEPRLLETVVQVFSADTTIIGHITGLSDEGF